MDKDHKTFQALVDEHGATVLAMLRRQCGNPHDADDLFQDVAKASSLREVEEIRAGVVALVRELDQLQREADLLDARRDADALELRFAPRTAFIGF
jgi:hypothetical protein